MKRYLTLVLLLSITLLSSCVSSTFQRGGDENCNCYFSSVEPALKITFEDEFKLTKEEDSAYLWLRDDNYLGIWVKYWRNKSLENTVDYYYPLDTVLYNIYGSRNKSIDYGEEEIAGQRFYFSDYIEEGENNRIYIIRRMAIQSRDHDILLFSMYHSLSCYSFKQRFETAEEYFEVYPHEKENFYKAVRTAIKAIVPYSPVEG